MEINFAPVSTGFSEEGDMLELKARKMRGAAQQQQQQKRGVTKLMSKVAGSAKEKKG